MVLSRFTIIVGPLLSGLLLWGCADDFYADDHHKCTAQVDSQLRPDDPGDPAGYEGADTDNLISPEGFVRVWWATEGSHQPPSIDANDSGIPDYVELAADIGDEVALLLDSHGWRLPLTPSPEEPLDLFLVDFSAGDGNFRPDDCYDEGGTPLCAGHLRVENNFEPLYYPNREYALRVVIAHEFFHAVQYAYHAEMPPWWAEGGATWFQEFFWEEQQDFERLTDFYFDDHQRSLNDRQRGAFDAYAYGASLFVYFLEYQIGADGLRRIHERMADNLSVEEAIDDVTTEEIAPLDDLFRLFAIWNIFTGDRAIDGQGYRDAERFAQTDSTELDADQALNWNVAVDPMAVRYARVDANRDVDLRLEPIDGHTPFDLVVVSPEEFADDGLFHHLPYDSDGPLTLEADQFPVFLVAANSDVDQSGSVQVQLRRATAGDDDDETPRDVDDDDGGGCSSTGGSPAGLPILAMILFLGLVRLFAVARNPSMGVDDRPRRHLLSL